jgi:serine protease Do
MFLKRMPRPILFCVSVALCAAALAQQPDVADSRRNAIVRAIERAAPAVVSVNVIVEQRPNPFGSDFWDLFALPVPRYRKVDSIGSGFIFDREGHILTNYHVVEGADYLDSVTLPDGRTLKVQLVGADKRTDLAVLKAEGSGFPYVELGDSSDLIIGEWVIAIGNPYGGLIRDPVPSVTVGVISATNRRVSPKVGDGERLYQNMIQTDAAINPGNSGGPLVNAKGQVIGVNTMIFSPSGGSIGLGFAIPINRARRVAEEIIRFGRRREPWPGFHVQDVAAMPEALRRVGPQSDSGCVVTEILKNSPAYQAGLRPGDVIVSVNGEPIRTAVEIDYAIWDLFIGDTATLTVYRDGKTMTISFPIVELTK